MTESGVALVPAMAKLSLNSATPENPFWAQFVGFVPNPTAGLATEFRKLAKHMGWVPGSKTWKRYREEAYLMEFEYHYGKDVTKLARWQALCEEVDITPVPQSIKKCKEALKRTHVNLVDLVNCRREGGKRKPRIFPSLTALRTYTLADKKRIYPKSLAKKEGFIKVLLREIFG